MTNILIIYSTTDGHTLKICRRLQEVIEQQHHRVTLTPIAEAETLALDAFDKIIIGASIRYGKHGKKVYDFVKHNKQILDRKPAGFFSVNLVARKPEKSQPDTNPYMHKFLKQVAWQPDALAVFAGKIDYRIYHFWDRQIIRLIMFVTHGPTHTDTAIEFTNWQQVEAFGKQISEM